MSLTFVFWSSKAVAMLHNTLHTKLFLTSLTYEIFPCLFLPTSVHECGHVSCYQTEVNMFFGLNRISAFRNRLWISGGRCHTVCFTDCSHKLPGFIFILLHVISFLSSSDLFILLRLPVALCFCIILIVLALLICALCSVCLLVFFCLYCFM